METRLNIRMLAQPDVITCGPTCLHAVYQYYGDSIKLKQVIREVTKLDEGGTLAVFLGCHALKMGYRAHIYTFNLQIFDPTWFIGDRYNLAERLHAQAVFKKNSKLQLATQGYLEFLENGGQILFQDLSSTVMKKYLSASIPIITGLSATYLYRSMREYGNNCDEDDIRGMPTGHFVVLCGYAKTQKRVLVADPYRPSPLAHGGYYHVGINRLIHSILLGIVTYDANILILQPK